MATSAESLFLATIIATLKNAISDGWVLATCYVKMITNDEWRGLYKFFVNLIGNAMNFYSEYT